MTRVAHSAHHLKTKDDGDGRRFVIDVTKQKNQSTTALTSARIQTPWGS